MTHTKTLPPETIEAGRIAELVEQVEEAERLRNHWMREQDRFPATHDLYRACSRWIDGCEFNIDQSRAELRAIIGCDPYRLADAIGA